MHDPLVLLWTIRRPPITRKEWRRLREKPFRWYRLPILIDIWHREPKGRDSGSVCDRRRWRWHLHHWHVRVWPVYHLRTWLFQRCDECGRRSTYGYAWHGYMSSDRVWHSECMEAAHGRSDRKLMGEVLHRLFEFYGITDDAMLRAIVAPGPERRDLFLLWYRPWQQVEHYRGLGIEDRWKAPNQRFTNAEILAHAGEVQP